MSRRRPHERLLAQPLGRGVEETRPALRRPPSSRAAASSCVSDELTNVAVSAIRGRKLVDLVLHQRDERREDERRRGSQHRRELVRERLARAGGHQRERVAAGERGAHDLLLPGAEVVEPEVLAQRGAEVGQRHPNECTVRSAGLCAYSVPILRPRISSMKATARG